MSGARILLFGKDGQVGYEARRALSAIGEVTALGRSDCDLEDELALRICLSAHPADVIVNASGYTNVDQAEADAARAFAVNARAVQLMARHGSGALIMHVSTDYVFDGSKSDPYVESDPTGPLNVYGSSKLAGEHALIADASRHVILRTSWVYGSHGGNFLKTMLRLGADREVLRVVGDQIGAPTPAWLIAAVIADVITLELRGTFAHGVYHLSPRGSTSWYDYARFAIAEAISQGRPMTIKPDSIERITTAEFPTPARRPANSCLSVDKLEQAIGKTMPAWTDGIGDAIRELP